MNILRVLLIVLVVAATGWQVNELSTLIQPIAKDTEPIGRRNILRESLIYLQCPRQEILRIQTGIEEASDKTGIGRLLLTSLLYTESRFRLSAISDKGYRGIAQTPTATMIYPEVDILHGAMILKTKLRLAKGNMIEALTLYKGGRNPVARKQARVVLQVYNTLLRRAGGEIG